VTAAPRIRPATEADGLAASAIFDAARTESLGFLPVLHTRDEDDAFFTTVMAGPDAWVAVDDDDRPTGFIAWTDGFVDHLYVHPDAQGTGIGTALLQLMQETHPEGLRLYVFQRNDRARRFYERRGFHAEAFGNDNEEHTPDILEHWPGRPDL